MKVYDLNKLLEVYTKENFSDSINYDDYKFWLEAHIKINKPDFIVLLSLIKADPVIYSKNYNLIFKEGSKETIYEIVKCVSSNQISNILTADKRCMEFVENNIDVMGMAMFQLKFTVSLIENQPRTLLRNISFIKKKHLDFNHFLLLTSISDITELVGVQNKASAEIRYICDKNKTLNNKLSNLKKELNSILSRQEKLTHREEQILHLIAAGKTSKEIAVELNITVNTVNTHRQNLIKKFNVNSTASLINFIT